MDAELTTNGLFAVQGENELARAQANIDDLEKMNRKLARSLAESSTTPPAANKVPFVTTPPASIPQATTPSVTTLLTNNPPATTPSGPLAAKPTITTAVPFGDEVLQHEVSKVCSAVFLDSAFDMLCAIRVLCLVNCQCT